MVSKKRKEKMSWSERLLYKYSKTYRQIWKTKETLEDMEKSLQILAGRSSGTPLSASDFVSFLNYTVDITKLPPAKGKMRALQLADAEILRIFDEVCQKHNLQYWLDFGTLLGAVRHQGFVPWDDDMDVAMPRKSYNQLFDILEEEFKGTDLYVFGKEKSYFDWNPFVRIGYKDTFLNLDVFPYDFYYKKVQTQEDKDILQQKMTEGREFFNQHYPIPDENEEKLTELRKIMSDYTANTVCENKIAEKPYEQTKPTIFKGLEDWAYFRPFYYDYDTIFPLRKLSFEGREYYAPAQYDKYLTYIYGNYMQFPENLKRHGDILISRLPDNINEIITKLQAIRIK